jgi:hypothetical protein
MSQEHSHHLLLGERLAQRDFVTISNKLLQSERILVHVTRRKTLLREM